MLQCSKQCTDEPLAAWPGFPVLSSEDQHHVEMTTAGLGMRFSSKCWTAAAQVRHVGNRGGFIFYFLFFLCHNIRISRFYRWMPLNMRLLNIRKEQPQSDEHKGDELAGAKVRPVEGRSLIIEWRLAKNQLIILRQILLQGVGGTIFWSVMGVWSLVSVMSSTSGTSAFVKATF